MLVEMATILLGKIKQGSAAVASGNEDEKEGGQKKGNQKKIRTGKDKKREWVKEKGEPIKAKRKETKDLDERDKDNPDQCIAGCGSFACKGCDGYCEKCVDYTTPSIDA